MDRPNEANPAWHDAGLPDLGPFTRETATPWAEGQAEPQPAPLPKTEEDLDEVIFGALVSPYV
jgi:hypothetical protein